MNTTTDKTPPLCLFRYDTESDEIDAMQGFLPMMVEVHRRYKIPVTLFCTGNMLDKRRAEFVEFAAEVRDDPLFDIQDHSYSHIGIGYEKGKPIEVLRDDYLRSFDVHESIFGKRPVAVSLCGTSVDGRRLTGFDETDKSRAELAMLVELGMREVCTFLSTVETSRSFCTYASLGYPEIIGFPGGFSDTGWMMERDADGKVIRREPFDAALATITDTIKQRGAAGTLMPLMMHDWCAWKLAPRKDLAHVILFAETARAAGFELVTHAEGCRRFRAAM